MPKSERRSFKYRERSAEDIRERANQKSGNFDTYILDKYKVYKPHDGKNLIRIMPPTWDGAKHYGYEIYVCYGIGVDTQAYLSLAKMKNIPDPLDEARRQAEKDGDKDAAKALAAKKRVCMWIIDRLHEDEGPMIWAAPWTLDRDIANLCYDEDTREIILIDHPDDGCDFRFYKEGTGRNTEYNPAKMKILGRTPLADDERDMDDWLEFVEANPIPDCLQYYDYDHINEVYGGHVRMDTDDAEAPKKRPRVRADDDETPPKSNGRSKASEETEEETEERAPRSRSVKRSADEDEAPAAPRRASRRDEPADEPDVEEEAEPPRRSSLRDKLRERRGAD